MFLPAQQPPQQDSFSELISAYPSGKTQRGLTLLGTTPHGTADAMDSDWTVYLHKREPQGDGTGAGQPFPIPVGLEVQTGRGRAGVVSFEGLGDAVLGVPWSRGLCFHYVGTEVKATALITIPTLSKRETILSGWIARGRPFERRITRAEPFVRLSDRATWVTAPIDLSINTPFAVIPTFARAFRVMTRRMAAAPVDCPFDAWQFIDITGAATQTYFQSTGGGATIDPASGAWIPIPSDATLVLLMTSAAMVNARDLCWVEWLIVS